jgi:glycosyltransferase involved in cell wall biosynthesis
VDVVEDTGYPVNRRFERDARTSVLAVTSEVPWPLDRGGHLRTFFLLRALATTCRVRLIAPISAPDAEAEQALRGAGIELLQVRVARRRRATEALRVARATIAAEPYVLYRRHRWQAVRAALRSAISGDAPDVCYLDHLDSFVYAADCGSTPIVIDLHNIYSELTARAADEAQQRLLRWFLRREASALARMEQRAVGAARVAMAVSERDQQYYSQIGARAVYLAPNGVDCRAYASLGDARRSGPPTILFVGAMSWAPNANAARFLAADVLPRVQARLPDARLRIVGRDAGPDVLALGRHPGVEVTGTVPDVKPYLAEADVMAVPLDAGGGTRLKILEAFAAGLPVVSTPIGAEGIDAIHGRDIWLAPRDRFAEGVAKLLADHEGRAALAANARTLVENRYDWSSVGRVARAAVAAASSAAGDADLQAAVSQCAGSEMVS